MSRSRGRRRPMVQPRSSRATIPTKPPTLWARPPHRRRSRSRCVSRWRCAIATNSRACSPISRIQRRREYHRWLTPDDFTSRFGPTAADLARVARWLKKKGFTVNSADASTREVSFTGTVAQAQNVFGVKIAATTDGRLYSNTADPAVPADLAPLVESIHGLDNLLHSKPLVHRVSKRGSSATSPASVVNGAGPAFGPPDIYTFYDETPLLNFQHRRQRQSDVSRWSRIRTSTSRPPTPSTPSSACPR